MTSPNRDITSPLTNDNRSSWQPVTMATRHRDSITLWQHVSMTNCHHDNCIVATTTRHHEDTSPRNYVTNDIDNILSSWQHVTMLLSPRQHGIMTKCPPCKHVTVTTQCYDNILARQIVIMTKRHHVNASLSVTTPRYNMDNMTTCHRDITSPMTAGHHDNTASLQNATM